MLELLAPGALRFFVTTMGSTSISSLHEASATTDTDLPFQLCWHQFPIRPPFAMTINKTQVISMSTNHAPGQAVASTSAQPSATSPPVTQDLPDLLAAGWCKCWSRREKRPYYFNRFTNQSLWEVPTTVQHDSISDPLGLNAAPVGSPRTTDDSAPRKRSSTEEPTAGLKRGRSEDVTPITPVTPAPRICKVTTEAPFASPTSKHKAPLVAFPVFWNLEVPSNVVAREMPPYLLFPPHPEAELCRAQLTARLRQHYQELCQQREGIDAPRESFNRWMLERKVRDRGTDPMLPSDCEPAVSPSMFREILNDIPIRLSRIKHREDAKRQLFKYAEAAKRMIESSRNATPDSRKIVKWNVEDTFNWLRKELSATKEDYLERLDHLRQQCGPHLADVAKESVEGICAKLYHLACEYAQRVRSRHLEILRECNLPPDEVDSVTTSCMEERAVPCHPARLRLPEAPLPRVDLHVESEQACLRHRGEVVRVNQNYLAKLEQLYRLNCTDDSRFEKFLPRVWCMLRRYQTMFGLGAHEGLGLHGALPVSVFEALHRHFDVTFECFASPLNCYFAQYCSAFPDTDGYFGSRGTVLDLFPASGSFEVNPPFGEELMNSMVDHFENLLAASTEPLSFVVFVPEWRDPATPALLRMEESCFKRRQLLVLPFEHEYRHGAQHVCRSEELHIRALHGTAILFLQNDAAYARWGPTPERIRALLEAYRPQGRAPQPAGPADGTAGGDETGGEESTAPSSAGGTTGSIETGGKLSERKESSDDEWV
uniref:mRNA (2'-O-methyladenosine-N(6)-)-methyltransferase isoform X3 n=2 Tax=Myxine glutinosa TaxID=7769 RepID=UPI00358F9ED2